MAAKKDYQRPLDLKQGRDLWYVKADVNQLEQVIINLVVNARDAMPDGGTVTIGTRNVDEDEARRLDRMGMPPAEYVRIDVSDTGTGIEPEMLPRLFERGTGLCADGQGHGHLEPREQVRQGRRHPHTAHDPRPQ